MKSILNTLIKNLAQLARFFYALFLSGFFLISCTGSEETNKKDNITIIQIDSHKLTLKQFLLKIQSSPSQLFNHQYQNHVPEFAKKQIIKQFLENYLLEAWAKEKNITIPSSKVHKQTKKLIKNYTDKVSFAQSLYNNSVSQKQLTQFIRSQLLRKEWIKFHKKELTAIKKKDIQSFLKTKKVFLKPVKVASLQHLLFKTETDAEIIHSFLRKNTIKFSNLYEILPQFNPILAQKKISVPYGASEVFDPAFKMKIGEISPIIKSSWGWHIYQVLKIEKNKKSLSKPYSFIKAILIEKKIDNLYQAWIKTQLKDKKVLINKNILKQL